jgi:transcriptional regulator with XRE-family HTH domain
MFNKRLTSLRKSKKLSQAEMAKILGIHRGTYSNYESGNRHPDYETLQSIADFFGVSTDYLLGRSDDPQKLNYQEISDLREQFITREKPLTWKGKPLSEDQLEYISKLIDLAIERDEKKKDEDD